MTKSTVFFATFETPSNCSQTSCTYVSIADLRSSSPIWAEYTQTPCTYVSIAIFAEFIFDVKNASDFTRSEILQNPGKCCSQDHFREKSEKCEKYPKNPRKSPEISILQGFGAFLSFVNAKKTHKKPEKFLGFFVGFFGIYKT